MELDKRIKDIDTIQTILKHNANDIGCKGYFFNNFVQAKILSKTHYGTLVDIVVGNDDYCFGAKDENGNDFIGYYKNFIPENALEPIEKKYRPFTAKEFIDKFEFLVGMSIRLREKDTGLCRGTYEYKTVLTGYRWCGECVEVFLNGKWYTMSTLLGSLEYIEDGEWKPFGIEE